VVDIQARLLMGVTSTRIRSNAVIARANVELGRSQGSSSHLPPNDCPAVPIEVLLLSRMTVSFSFEMSGAEYWNSTFL
jgi:hypothetical protein